MPKTSFKNLDLKAVFSNTPSCLKIINKDGALLSMNKQGLDLIEAKDFTSVENANVYEIVKDVHRDNFIKFNEKICSGKSGSLIFEIVGLKGTVRWMETYAAPFKLESGEFAHIAITNDITEKVQRDKINKGIEDIRKNFINYSGNYQKFFDFVLKTLIEITESEYGFIGQIKVDEAGKKFLKTMAITDISWNEETKKFYEEGAPEGLEFKNLETLFGEVIKSQKVLMTSNAPKHPKAAGIPKGHPPLNAFLGVPLFFANEFIAMVGIANRKDGYSNEFYEYMKPLFEVVGEIIGSHELSMKNIESTKKLQDLNEYLELALQGSGLGIWDWYLESNEVYYDKRWVEMIGYQQDEIEMNFSTWRDNVHPDDLESCQKEITKYLDGKVSNYEMMFRMKHKNGSWVHILAQGRFSSWDAEGKPTRFTGTHLNITKQKEQEVELVKAKNSAQEAERAKSRFLANMSHEIRTPMNGLMGMMDILKDTQLNPDQSEMLEIMNNSSETLMSLLNDILDLSKIESGKINLEINVFNINDIIHEVKSLFSSQIQAKGLNFFIENNLELNFFKGDRFRIQQVLSNLISNAVKFTHQGEIRVGINQTSQELVLEVSDTGIGISKEFQNTIFEEFTQANNSISNTYGGSGLGLAIISNLIEKMNGKINVESELNKGTTFKVYLPLEAASNEEISLIIKKDEKLVINKLENKRVLIVEDNQINITVAQKMLLKLDCVIDVATNGLDALKKVDVNKYDLILMDMRMPIMDGVEATKKLRKRFSKTDLPIVAMTANAYDEDIESCLAAGMNEFIAKPLNLKKILQATENLF